MEKNCQLKCSQFVRRLSNGTILQPRTGKQNRGARAKLRLCLCLPTIERMTAASFFFPSTIMAAQSTTHNFEDFEIIQDPQNLLTKLKLKKGILPHYKRRTVCVFSEKEYEKFLQEHLPEVKKSLQSSEKINLTKFIGTQLFFSTFSGF